MTYTVNAKEFNEFQGEHRIKVELEKENGDVVASKTLSMTYNQFNNKRLERLASWAMTCLEMNDLETFEDRYSSSMAIEDGIVQVEEEY